jgi:Flp pilus assembly pilin Flp
MYAAFLKGVIRAAQLETGRSNPARVLWCKSPFGTIVLCPQQLALQNPIAAIPIFGSPLFCYLRCLAGHFNKDLQSASATMARGTRKMVHLWLELHREDSGQDLIEYALIATILSLSAVIGMGQLASSINREYRRIAEQLPQ